MAEPSAVPHSLAPPAGGETISAPLLGSDPSISSGSSTGSGSSSGVSSVQLELLVRDGDELATPFVEEGHGAADERRFTGLLRLPSGTILHHVQFRLQTVLTTEQPQVASASDMNWHARARWVMAHPDVPPARFVVGDCVDESGANRLTPRFYCRARQRFFKPRSPISLQPLVTCRDTAWLQQHGVPDRVLGGLPVLYSPADRAANTPKFYAEAAVPGASEELIGDLDQCILDQGRVASEIEARAASDPQLADAARVNFPCYRCPSHGECYPESGFARARERLTPLNFYDVTAIATLRCDQEIGAYCDWLTAGAPLGEVVSPQSALRLWLQDDLASDAWLCERVFLQCSLIAQLAECVAAFWERYQHGIGCLAERSVGVHLATSGGPAPRLWNATIGLHGIEDGERPTNTAERDPKYILRRNLVHAPGSEFRGQGRLTPDTSGEALVGWLTAPSLRPMLGLGDQVTLNVRPSVDTVIPLKGVVVGFVGEVLQLELHSANSSAIDLAALENKTCEAEYHFTVQPSVADDLYAIGVLIFRTLWAANERPLAKVLQQAESLGQQLAGVTGAEERAAIITQVIQQGQWRPILSPGSDAKRNVPEAVSEALAASLTTALALITQTAPPLDLVGVGEPLGLLQAVADRCVAIARRLEGVVMPSNARHAAHEILNDLLAAEAGKVEKSAASEDAS